MIYYSLERESFTITIEIKKLKLVITCHKGVLYEIQNTPSGLFLHSPLLQNAIIPLKIFFSTVSIFTSFLLSLRAKENPF